MPDQPDRPSIGEMPTPEAEEPARNPGGPDAINDDAPFEGDDPTPLSHDLDPDDNPAVEDHMPDEVKQLDEKLFFEVFATPQPKKPGKKR